MPLLCELLVCVLDLCHVKACGYHAIITTWEIIEKSVKQAMISSRHNEFYAAATAATRR